MRYSEETLEAIVYLFEQVNGLPVEPYALELIKKHSLTDGVPSKIVDSLIDIVRRDDSLDVSYRISVYWALSKRNDKSLVPFFVERLAFELPIAPSTVYQLLIALDNTGEDVFGGDRDGFSVLETELNLRDAKRYLKQKS